MTSLSLRSALPPLLLFVLSASACTHLSQKSDKATADAQDAVATPKNPPSMYPELQQYIESILPDTASIDQDRKAALAHIAGYIGDSSSSLEPAKLTFICTHNSRRSHMSQLWAAAAAFYFGIQERVRTYSGGTEATAFNPRAVAAMRGAGFRIPPAHGDNPHYRVHFSANAPALTCFSKTYDDAFNPQSHFAAIMTCSAADENCPFIPGASLRVAIPYDDPKASDGTAEEKATYDARCRQIATEMCYLMAQVK